MTTNAQTAAEAYSRYQAALAEDTLVQRTWHHTAEDGRQLACALGVIGADINSASACPAQIMPRWLAQMTVWMFDAQKIEDALPWGSKFYAEIARLNGVVPFSVIHDWQANVVGPLAIEASKKRGRKAETHEALAAMQAEALTGKKFTADEWRPVLKAAFFDADANAAAYANADAYAYANADADADAYADAYADADANAYAYAYAYANAYANVDAYANADAYAYANANADAYAYAYAKQSAVKRLADGLVECLARVPADLASPA